MILFLPFLFDELVKFEDKRVLTESRQGSCFPFLHFSQQKYELKANGIQKVFKKYLTTKGLELNQDKALAHVYTFLHFYRQNLYSKQWVFKKYSKKYFKTKGYLFYTYSVFKALCCCELPIIKCLTSHLANRSWVELN